MKVVKEAKGNLMNIMIRLNTEDGGKAEDREGGVGGFAVRAMNAWNVQGSVLGSVSRCQEICKFAWTECPRSLDFIPVSQQMAAGFNVKQHRAKLIFECMHFLIGD